MGPRRVRSFLFRRQANKQTSKVKAKAARQVKSKTNTMQRKWQHYCISVSAQASIPDSSVSAVLAEPRHDIMLPRFYDSCFRGRRPLERGERPRACAYIICLCRHLPRSEGARRARNRCHSCRHGHAKQIVTFRCGGALSSRVLSYSSPNTIEYDGQSSTRHLEIVRFFLGAAIPRGDCGCCAVMQCCGPSWWRCKETWI